MHCNSPPEPEFEHQTPTRQGDIVRFLCELDVSLDESGAISIRNYSEPSQHHTDADVITTHCAFLIRHQHFVFKVKRAISYSYLDMNSLNERRRLCQRELELNQPELPDIYLDVVPVTLGGKAQLELDGSGTPVEWVLRMKRFDEGEVMDNVAREGNLDVELASRLGQAVSHYHQKLDSVYVEDGCDRMAEIVAELKLEFSVLDKPLPAKLVSRFSSRGHSALQSCGDLLDERGQAGYVKRCHGDLHLRNLLLHEGQPVPFDALEFDERLGTCDVLYDLAFLVMDLGHRGLREQENRVLNQYLLHSVMDNTRALSLMPLFLGCRAAIHAMTSAQGAAADSANASELQEEATHYLQSAVDYLSFDQPVLVAIGGVSGTGKSTIANRLPTHVAASPGAVLFRSDTERKAYSGVAETEHLPAHHYTPENAAINYDFLMQKAASALEAGFSTIVDATFLKEAEQHHIEQLATTTSARFVGLWLSASDDLLRSRITQRKGDASDATLAVLDVQLNSRPSAPAWNQIDSGGDVADTLRQCLDCLV